MEKDRTRHGRREVAERLRGVTEEELQYVFLEEILNSAVGGRCFDDEGDIDNGLILNRLADLIDPTCKNLATKPADVLFCSGCGEYVDIAYVENEDDYHARYCPHCGARVVTDDD